MTFHSPEFILFLSVTLFLYFKLPLRFRNTLLLAASAMFYMWWRPEYLVLILFSVTVDYFVALGLGREGPSWKRKTLLIVSLVSNLGLLFFFKYFEFATESVRSVLAILHVPWEPPLLKLVLPIGISFHTFQALSYTIDVYRGQIPIERSLLRLWVYVLFFPQLVAGPIERAGRLLPQFDEVHAPDPDAISSGLKRILWGLVKKVAIADRLGLIADQVYDHPLGFSSPSLLIATYAFAFQIYADFSAYSDIAIGAARCLGFRLAENFDRPYLARSPVEFWRRWHISLSSWFRDYVYVPLGGNREGRARWRWALMLTFCLSGLWHGARWTFVIWGAYHGLFVLGWRSWAKRIPSWVGAVLTFHGVLIGWVFFRANTLSDATYILTRSVAGQSGAAYINVSDRLPQGSTDLVLAGAGIVALLLADLRPILAWSPMLRWLAYVGGALLVLNGRPEIDLPFIYFQF
ncbi:MAG TPA: MBOAT family O-acyltransferase [Planctomycetota bacterium]|nr:MBOAT family O-acyltransferase [Planctomycetota bacterium]